MDRNKTYTDGRRPHVTLDYARWWCSMKDGYTYGRYV
jgi:hypothetical protein